MTGRRMKKEVTSSSWAQVRQMTAAADAGLVEQAIGACRVVSGKCLQDRADGGVARDVIVSGEYVGERDLSGLHPGEEFVSRRPVGLLGLFQRGMTLGRREVVPRLVT